MFGICLRFTRNNDEAKEVLQDGFIRVFRNLHTFRSEGTLEGWIRRIIIHNAINFVKSKGKFGVETELENTDCHATFADEILSKLAVDELLVIIRQLPKGYQTIFNLYVNDGMTHKEIGELLGISEETSKSQLFRARNRIRQIMKERSGFGLDHISS